MWSWNNSSASRSNSTASCSRRHLAPRTPGALPYGLRPLQAGYEPLIRSAGTVTAGDLDRLHVRLTWPAMPAMSSPPAIGYGSSWGSD